MTKGFTIKCNECGHETTMTKPKQSMSIESSDNVIGFGAVGYGGEVGIWCECGNKVRDDQ